MTSYVYDPASRHADEFINHQEILETLEYARAHKDDLELCRAILAKAHPNVAPKKEQWEQALKDLEEGF